MVQPINYLAQMPQIDINKGFLESIQGAALLGQMQQRQQEQQQKTIEAQQKEQRLQAYRSEIENAFTQGTPQAFARLMTMFPEHQAAIKPQFEQLSKDRQSGEIAAALPVASALLSGNAKVAKDLIEVRIKATPEGQDSSGLQALSSLIDADPQAARNYALMGLSQVMAPDKFAETFGKLAEAGRAETMAPITMRKEKALSAQAEEQAKQAAIKSRFAESEAVIDLEKKGWDIRKIQSDMAIAKQNAQIAAANVQIGRTTNDLKRQELELKVDEMKQKRDSSVREKAAEVESARFNIDNMLNTSQRILNNPSLNSVIGTMQGRAPVFLSDEAQDAVALIETLGSQAFLSQIPNVKGMGQLSNAEGDKLQNSLQNLSRVQSEKQFRENLQEATRLLKKARENVSMRFGVPETAPDVPAAKGAAAPAAGGFTVTAPNGQTFSFPTKQAADQFKQAAGIR